jgi:hypothetical protein
MRRDTSTLGKLFSTDVRTIVMLNIRGRANYARDTNILRMTLLEVPSPQIGTSVGETGAVCKKVFQDILDFVEKTLNRADLRQNVDELMGNLPPNKPDSIRNQDAQLEDLVAALLITAREDGYFPTNAGRAL